MVQPSNDYCTGGMVCALLTADLPADSSAKLQLDGHAHQTHEDYHYARQCDASQDGHMYIYHIVRIVLFSH